MKIALIGLPQAGKKTLFTLLTGRRVPESRKPGESVEGAAAIRDPRVDALAEVCRPQKTTYAQNQFVLCPDAEAGSYEWLAAARRGHLVCRVDRAFAADEVYHPAGTVDPARDCDNLEAELLLADMEVVEKRLVRLDKETRAGALRPEQKLEQEVLRRCMAALEDSRRLADAGLAEIDLVAVRHLELVTLLPLLRVYNVAEADLAAEWPAGVLAISARIEQEIMTMDDPAERHAYLEVLGLSASGLDRMNQAAYDALGLMSFYTAGPDECRAWTIHKGSPAPVAGGKIHSDIERGFIRAEIIKLDDYLATGSESTARAQGKVQIRGRDYLIEDGDVVHFLHSA
ncbi:MAG: DUF933 domain-containing protein [Gemmatimonadota bacterium]